MTGVPLIALAAAVLLALALPVLAFAVVPSGRRAAAVSTRLRSASGAEREPDAPRYLSPPSLLTRMERNLQLAGLTGEWSLRGLLIGKAAGAGAGLVVGALLFGIARTPLAVLVGVALAVLGYLIPDLIVSSRARERQARIQADLADTLDQIMISIEAGLGLETAVARAGRHGRGPLADEFTRTIQDMRVGMSRKEAYTALSERTSVSDLRRFARAIMQADQYGVSVSNVVRTQAKELRTKRRQRAEEKAMRVPVLVLFPLMFCILPVLFVVVLGPALVNLVGAFSTISR
jgi:tight adherence protein C